MHGCFPASNLSVLVASELRMQLHTQGAAIMLVPYRTRQQASPPAWRRLGCCCCCCPPPLGKPGCGLVRGASLRWTGHVDKRKMHEGPGQEVLRCSTHSTGNLDPSLPRR